MLLTAFSTPALADYNYAGWPVTNRVNGTVNGGVFFDYEPWVGDQSEGTTDLNHSFDVPSGTVKHAYLYTGVWGGSLSWHGWINVTFNGIDDQNGLGPVHLEGTSDTNSNVWATGKGKYWWWYNVTNLTNAGETNTAHTWKINGSIDGRVYGIVLVVIYEGGDAPKNIQYWLNDGCDSLYHDTKNAGTTDFSGTVDTGSITEANLTLAHLTAYDPTCSNCLKFNGHELSTSMVDSNTFELNTWDVTSYVESSGNDAWYSRGGDDYISVTNAILVLEGKPDLKITKAWVNWTDGVGCDCTIKYIIENVGKFPSRGNFTNHLYVNGQFAASDSVVYGLSPGESREKNFSYTWTYTPPTDDIAICADYNNTVEENNENNWYVDWLSGTTNTTWGCGDVNNDKVVNMIDVFDTFDRFAYNDRQLHEWAADANNDLTIDMIDVFDIFDKFAYGKDLNCWCD